MFEKKNNDNLICDSLANDQFPKTGMVMTLNVESVMSFISENSEMLYSHYRLLDANNKKTDN